MDLFRYTVLNNYNKCTSDNANSVSFTETFEVKPSIFKEEMQLTTEQRTERIIKTMFKSKTKSTTNLDIFPNVVIYQNFKEILTYTILVTIVNVGKNLCPLQVLFKQSPHFSITYEQYIIPDKLAPGMELQFSVHFTPELMNDYSHVVKILTPTEEYIVPIIAVCPRPIFDIPDNILIPESPVNIGAQKCVFVKNIGEASGVFNIYTHPPFSVEPSCGILDPKKAIQLIVTFKPFHSKHYKDVIKIKLESGEVLVIDIEGSSKCIDVSLNKNSVHFENTYMGLKCSMAIEIQNKSEYVASFSWKMYSSYKKDEEVAASIRNSLFEKIYVDSIEAVESEINEIVHNRIYNDDLNRLNATEQFLFNDPHFMIVPTTGEIWPNTTSDITIIFSPEKVEEYSCIAYCDITGMEERLKLSLHGNGKGAKFKCSIDTLNLDRIYLHSGHCFEIAVVNIGNIPGKISYVDKEYEFGSTVTSVPKSVELLPFEYGAFNMSYYSHNEGVFIEEMHFCIEHSNEIIKVFIEGSVLYPKISVSTTEINFGIVSLGYQTIKSIELYNPTYIAVPYEARVFPDGSTTATLCSRVTKSCDALKIDPKEFECSPASGEMPPNSSLDMTITLTPNIVRKTVVTLEIITWNTPAHNVNVQVKFDIRLPELVCIPPDISIRFCFINYLCQRLIQIKNKTNLWGFVKIYPEKSTGLQIETDISEAAVVSHGIIEVQLNIICIDLGRQTANLKLQLYGGGVVDICTIDCVGQGPVVSITPAHLNFFDVELLRTCSDIIHISNDSPISAELTFKTDEKGPWSILTKECQLEPEEGFDLEVFVYLNDTRHFQGILYIGVSQRGIIECILSANGVGTSIVVSPVIEPILDLGSQLTKKELTKKIKFTNKGIRYHQMLISPSKELKSLKYYKPEEYPTLFCVHPHLFSLKPAQSIVVTITGYCKIKKEIEETFYVHATIEKMDKKEIIIETTIMVKFVEPNIVFSKKDMCFRVDVNVDECVNVIKDVVNITNNSDMKLRIDFKTKPPFYILEQDEQLEYLKINLENGASYYLTIFFEAENRDKRCFSIRKRLEISYMNHPHKDFITLRASVHYPNVELHPNYVDFGCATSDSYTSYEVELKNVSPLPVKYNFEWSEADICFLDIPLLKDNKLALTDEIIVNLFDSRQSTISFIPSIVPTEISEIAIEKNVTGKKGNKGKLDKKFKKTGSTSKKSKESGKESRKTKESDKSKTKKKKIKLLPVVLIFQHYYTEIYLLDENVQIFQVIQPPLCANNFIGLSERTRENLKQMKQLLYQPVHDYSKDLTHFSVMKYLDTKPVMASMISEVMQLIPFQGYLEPYESQMISFLFHPKDNTTLNAKLYCHVLGGPTEHLTLTGETSDINYYVDKTFLDFGRKVLCESCRQTINLMNIGNIPFTFITTAKEVDSAYSPQLLDVGWLTVQPQTGTLSPQTNIDINVTYFPGIGGKFFETFDIEKCMLVHRKFKLKLCNSLIIDSLPPNGTKVPFQHTSSCSIKIIHLPPITITVSGYGVYSQVYLSLPRPALRNLTDTICYDAIASLSPEFLKSVEEIRVWTESECVSVPPIPNKQYRNLQKNGWVIVTYNRKIPSLMDIDLAIERLLSYKCILHKSILLMSEPTNDTSNPSVVPKFRTLPYVLDFGYVVVNTMVHNTVSILNYGPTNVKTNIMTNLKKSPILAAGFDIQFVNNECEVGDSIQLYVMFFPSLEVYTNVYKMKEIMVKQVLQLKVLNGPKISIIIQAVVTYPFLETSSKLLNFGQVECGKCKVMEFIIKNTGYVPCVYGMRIEKKRFRNIPEDCDVGPIYFLKSDSGALLPGAETLCTVYFEPNRNSFYRWKMIIEVHQNPEEYQISFDGKGIEPWLNIEQTELEFDAALPYSCDSVRIFTVENLCLFPIEYYLADYDDQVQEEDSILRILHQYYSTKVFYIPPRLVGEHLPIAFSIFYQDLIKELKHYLKAQNEIRYLDDQDRMSVISQVPVHTKKHKKVRVSKSFPHSDPSQRSVVDPFLGKTNEEVEEMLSDFLKTKMESVASVYPISQENVKDPLADAIIHAKSVPPLDGNYSKEGIVIIFHGAPFTDAIYAANKAAKEINLPAVNLNQLIIESLAYNQTLSSTTINDFINAAVQDFTGPVPIVELPETPIVSTTALEEEIIDPIDELEDKLVFIRTSQAAKRKPDRGSKKGSHSSKSSKKSSKSGGSKGKGDATGTFLGIPQDLFIDLLKHKISERKTGVVIETLNNDFITCPFVALTVLLTAIGNTKYIHCILLYKSFENYYQTEQDKAALALSKSISETNAMLERFDEMTDEEIENLSPEYMRLYKEVYIVSRKEKTKQRLEKLKNKKLPHIGLIASHSREKKKKKDSFVKENDKKEIRASMESGKSNTSSKKSKIPSVPPELKEIQDRFLDFILIYEKIAHIAEYWDRELCVLTKEFIKKTKSKKEKKKPKSPKSKKKDKGSQPEVKSAVIIENPVEHAVGIPLWIINVIDEETEYYENIATIIKSFLNYQECHATLLDSLVEKLETSTELFSALYEKIEKRIQPSSNVFALTSFFPEPTLDLDLLDMEEEDALSFYTLRDDKLNTSATLISEQQRSLKHMLKNASQTTASSTGPIEMLEIRVILQPGDKRHYMIRFSPKSIGLYEHAYAIEMVGWPTKYNIKCTAYCDIPKIDFKPNIVFNQIISERIPSLQYLANVFIEDTEVYDFGNALLECRKNERRPCALRTTFNIRNNSLVPCEISVLLVNEQSDVFQFEPDIMYIYPNDVQYLNLNACPVSLGSHTNTLVLIIKNNPKAEIVQLECTGCKLSFDIAHKVVIFERILLNHKARQTVTLYNHSMIPVNWQFSNKELFEGTFNFTPEYGFIKPCDAGEIVIEYLAVKVEVLSKMKLYIQLLDVYSDEEPLHTDFIEITAETRDLQIECDQTINFGEVKARKDYKYHYNFLNHGTHSILFEINILYPPDTINKEIRILKMFEASALTGNLPPHKTVTITISFNSYKMIDITDFPIFECNFMDHIHKTVLSTFFIKATVKTYYSRFELTPHPDINFGVMLVGTIITRQLSIKNVGTLEFEYNVMCKRTLDEIAARLTKKSSSTNKVKSGKKDKTSRSSKSDKKSKDSKKTKDSKASKASKKDGKTKGRKIGPTILCGGYTIKNAKGIIGPGEESILDIESKAIDIGINEEILLVIVSESEPKDRLGRKFALTTDGSVPHINFDDIHTIFQEHFIVDMQNDFIKPKELGNHCVFVIDDNCLIFNNVCINTTASAQLKLYNDSLLEAEVRISSTLPAIFNISPPNIFIPPYSHGYFKVNFTPILIESYKAKLDLELVMPTSFAPNMVVFKLSGKGRVPQVTMIQPKILGTKNITRCTFSPTVTGNKVFKLISIQNTGDFPCGVIIEIMQDAMQVFGLHIKEDTLDKVHCHDTSKSFHAHYIDLLSGDMGNFNLSYQPNQDYSHKCVIVVHTINNPFESYKINVSGTSFYEDVILENITTIPHDISLISNVSEIADVYCTSYDLDFGEVYINNLQKSRFKIRNRSPDTFKFKFRSTLSEVTFIPTIGHLKPTSCKDVIVTFLTENPVTYKKILMECVICKITIEEEEGIDEEHIISWDDRQKLVIWQDRSPISSSSALDNSISNIPLLPQKLIEENIEPDYIVIENSIKRIPIMFGVLADYSKYECEIENIQFTDTLLFEKRVYTFSILNTGNVNLEIKWNILLNERQLRKITGNSKTNLFGDMSDRSKTITDRLRTAPNKARPLSGKETFIGEQCASHTSTASSLSRYDECNPDGFYTPLNISPETILIKPKDRSDITMTFSPLDVFDYKGQLKAKILNLSPELKPINLDITATSLMPYCHFDVWLSDYISSGRRIIESCEDILDVGTKVVEFRCLGVGIKHEKTFNIINPTENIISFSWQVIKSYEYASVPIFNCQYPSGSIQRGKQREAIFNVYPQNIGIFEALYNFKIENCVTSMQFLFVANVREANVNYFNPHLTLKPTIFGIPSTEYIKLQNNEEIDLNFKFLKSSLFSEGRKQCVTLEPRKGILLKKSVTKIKITYLPSEFGEVLFDLKCKIDYCKHPLILKVSCTCYEVQPIISYVFSGKRNVLSADSINVVDIGEILPRHTETIPFKIENAGNIGFFYLWNYNEVIIERKFDVTLKDKSGYIKVKSDVISNMEVTAFRNTKLKDYKIEFKIEYGPSYTILLNASVMATTYKFSFMEFDFGPCFIQNSTICYYHTSLEFLNCGNGPVTLENAFINTESLTVDFKMKTIMAKSNEMIHICFHPSKCQKFAEDISFFVNSREVKVKILGTGVQVELCLVDIVDKCIDFGAPEIGKMVTKTIQVINKSATTVEAIFDIWDRLPIVAYPLAPPTHYLKIPVKERITQEYKEEAPKKGKKGDKGSSKDSKKSDKSKEKSSKRSDSKDSRASKKSDKSSKKSDKSSKKNSTKSSKTVRIEPEIIPETAEEIHRRLIKSFVTIEPKPVTIKPNKIEKIVINYLPKEKIDAFSEKISVQVLETIQTLCIIKGAVSTSAFKLNRNIISFGVIIRNCIREDKLMLLNEGDTGASFKWDINKIEDFSIKPLEGYSSPGTSVTFHIKFHPVFLGIRNYKMHCLVDGYEKPLILNVTGVCSDLPTPVDTLTFTCPVRAEDKQSVVITNSTGQYWKLTPTITGDYFTCNEVIDVPAKASSICSIMYQPFAMTMGIPHTGYIFFKIPSGEAIVYNLIGIADSPLPILFTALEMPCKTHHTQRMTIKNWAWTKQQYLVFTEDVTPGNNVILYEVKGQAYIDVLPNEERVYEWHFYAYKECSLEFRVIFMDCYKEYMFHHLKIKVTKARFLETIHLTTCVRMPITYNLTLINPLDTPVNYKISSNSQLLLVKLDPKLPVLVEPHTQVDCLLEYQPLRAIETTAKLDASCAELGLYSYEFILAANAAPLEQVTTFSVTLGETQVKNIILKNLSRSKAIFTSQIDDENTFNVAKVITVLPAQILNVYVTFNPSQIGNTYSLLTISSPVAGDFVYPLSATCTEPHPKGPFSLRPDQILSVEFLNPFLEDSNFGISIEPELFVSNTKEVFVNAKSVTTIVIKMEDTKNYEQSTNDISGKMVIQCKSQSINNIKWVYYLNGIVSNTVHF